MPRIVVSVLAAFALLAATASTALMSTSFTIPARTYQIGTTSGTAAVPVGSYSHFNVTADFSPWTAPTSTTNVELGIMLSYDGGTTFVELCSAGENTPPPWTIPAKYGGGTSSTVTLDCFIPNGSQPTNAAGFVNVFGAAVNLGQIVVTLS